MREIATTTNLTTFYDALERPISSSMDVKRLDNDPSILKTVIASHGRMTFRSLKKRKRSGRWMIFIFLMAGSIGAFSLPKCCGFPLAVHLNEMRKLPVSPFAVRKRRYVWPNPICPNDLLPPRNRKRVTIAFASVSTVLDSDSPEESTSTRKEITRKSSTTKIITCSSSKELANAASSFVQPGHKVAELGSQLRAVSTAICQSLMSSQGDQHTTSESHAMLVDVTRRYPKSEEEGSTRTDAMRLLVPPSIIEDDIDSGSNRQEFYPSVATFCEIDQLQDWRSAFFYNNDPQTDRSSTHTSRTTSTSLLPVYNVFVLDVNAIVGNDLEWTSLSIIKEFEALNDISLKHNNNNTKDDDDDDDQPSRAEPLIVLVKSTTLNQWAARLVHGQNWIRARGVHHTIRPPYIIPTVGVQEYRQTIPYTVQPGDAVLEVGCHLGTSTSLLHEAAAAGGGGGGGDGGRADWDPAVSAECIPKEDSGSSGYCIGVDIGSKIIQGAKARYPDVYFRVGDAWRTAEILRIQQDYYDHNIASRVALSSQTPGTRRAPGTGRIGFDVVYVDVGGLSGNDGLLEAISLISSIRFALEPRCIVIKSKCIRRLSSALTPYWRIQKQQKARDG